ncbi:SLAP domain-containing protein [Lactobacillus crispatus]|jgi:bacterial surface layer protein|uniref:SLAP domain-containing protein n=1 Tax=Lactobacillus crispatus TaxID=47770 RepID=UPI0023A9FBEC|nr:SLAP domain-containing protein [Lactobacillus crispatus]MDK7313578.1 SLAP domain-containing protein [Lactobacillus crispatus]WEB33897.1 SLAP domain-containing protein [Lactobacillus crispatus]
MIMMKKNKIALISAATLMTVAPLTVLTNTTNEVQAATTKAVMHTALAYDKDGNSTGVKYNAYQYVTVESNPVKIDGSLYYKVSGKDQYIKATNIDGVTRKITHNTYIYRTSTGRTSYNNRWKLYKGETITTYGGSYKFKNGKHYFRIGGPNKQYIKSYNLGPVISVNTNNNTSSSSSQTTKSEETTVTVTDKRAALFVEVPDKDAVQPSGKYAKQGDKFTVDRLEQGTRADTGRDGDDDNELAIYHIKGTDYWIYNFNVKAAKDIPVQNYYHTKKSLIQFIKPTDIYDANGNKIDFKGDQVRKQGGRYKVNKLLYIWVPSENKAELFYHLVGKSVYSNQGEVQFADGYVKASDVRFDPNSTSLTPSNTAAEAEAAAQKK